LIEEVYKIVVSKVDEDLGYDTADFIDNVEFKEYPSKQDILTALQKFNGDVAKVEKRYRIIK
jgi:hypothetical protein